MSARPRGTGSEFPNLLSALTRRRLLKVSLIGAGSLAATATGLSPLERLLAAPPSLGRWLQLNPKTAPSPRSGAAMAYDAARRTTVLFGGSNYARDTWAWDGNNWTRLSPPQSPSERFGASLAYHPPTKNLVLFGGSNAKLGFLGDTWFWDGQIWTPHPTGGPPEREGASMAFDPITGSIILFGGRDESGPRSDTWGWNGKSWRDLSPSFSFQLSFAGFAYSVAIGKLVLFGGYGGMAEPDNGNTLAWDGSNWSRLQMRYLDTNEQVVTRYRDTSAGAPGRRGAGPRPF